MHSSFKCAIGVPWISMSVKSAKCSGYDISKILQHFATTLPNSGNNLAREENVCDGDSIEYPCPENIVHILSRVCAVMAELNAKDNHSSSWPSDWTTVVVLKGRNRLPIRRVYAIFWSKREGEPIPLLWDKRAFSLWQMRSSDHFDLAEMQTGNQRSSVTDAFWSSFIYSSRIIAELMPIAPTECTRARRLWSTDDGHIQGFEIWTISNGLFKSGKGSSQLILDGSIPLLNASATFATDTPAALTPIWPRFPLIDPRAHFHSEG